MKTKIKTIAMAVGLSFAASAAIADVPYEVWGADQSNSVAGAGARGVNGSYMWIWNSEDVKTQLGGGADAQPLGCDGNNVAGAGPCDLKEVFPGTLEEFDGENTTGNTLADLPNFGRLHGMLPDPQHMYMNINSFVPGGGYVGIVDGATKEAVALFRVTQTNAPSGSGRSLHMSFWNSDGSALFLANLHGRILERIDIKRNKMGKIVQAKFNRSASLGVGKNMTVVDEATAFIGQNAHGNDMVGTVKGTYNQADLGNLTPEGKCRENGCGDGPNAGRGANVIVCPIVSDSDKVYITFGGGGLLVADGLTTPMSIVAEYDNATLNGAGCGGVQVGDHMWLNAGASAASSGATQSTFTMYTIDDTAPMDGTQGENMPLPTTVLKDAGNTMTIGNNFGPASNISGQLPGVTTRRDAHGMARTLDGGFIHNIDRLQNNVEVFNTASMSHVGGYDLTSANGDGTGGDGPCAAASVTDDAGLPTNDVAPDLMDTTPDGNYLVVATRGPIPVSVTHNAQGSCPGVGIIELTAGGSSGKLAGVLRTTNTLDDAPVSAPGGHAYTGSEHSDPHGASVRRRVEEE